MLVVAAAGLGTLNHTALTVEALGAQSVPCAGVIVGAYPAAPNVAEASNLDALAEIAPVRAVLPSGSGALDPASFADLSARVFSPDWLRSLL